LPRGRRLGAAELGLLATVGKSPAPVFARPVVAILPTGDEVVPVEQRPEWLQIRNSNAISLAAQVDAAGGIPRCLEIAPDRPEALRALIQEGLASDLLLLTGGVSVGKSWSKSLPIWARSSIFRVWLCGRESRSFSAAWQGSSSSVCRAIRFRPL
jgi:molybdopterin biosynthesis enzyme